MRTAVLAPVLLMLGAHAEAVAAQCASYYISEITLVSPADSDAGHVQVYVGFGLSREEAEKNALGSCSRIKQDLETCAGSDRASGRNVPPDKDGSPLHFRYSKAVSRITGCD